MYNRVLVFNRYGDYPIEAECKVSSMEWNDTDITEAKIVFPLSFVDSNEEILNVGNIVYIETEDVAEWAGVLMLPITWGDEGVEVTAKNPNYYLARRNVVDVLDKSHTAGAAALIMINDAKKRGFMPIEAKPQNVDASGEHFKDFVREELTVLENLRRLARAGGFEFWIEPVIERGRIHFDFHWQKRKRHRGAPIEIGGNAAWGSPAVILSGDVITVWHVTETEKQVGAGSRVLLEAEEAKENYGHWEGNLSVPRINSGKQRSGVFRRAVQENGRPETRYMVQVEIGAGNKFILSEEIKPGHIHWLYGNKYGITDGVRGTQERVRVLHVEYRENQGYLTVVLQKWDGVERKEWIP